MVSNSLHSFPNTTNNANMDIPQPNNAPQYNLHSVPVRIRHTGEHSLQHFHLQESEKETVTYLRGRKLVGEKLPLENAVLLRKEFDELRVVGVVKQSTWFEREGEQLTAANKIKEMQSLSEVIHG